MRVIYRPLSRSEVAACADVHRSAFPGFFLSALGPAFLREFYGGHVADPDAVTVVAIGDADDVLGVVVGSTHPRGFYRRLLIRRWFAFATASLGLVLRRPWLAPRLMRAVSYRGGTSADGVGALLSSICVSPEGQRLALGSELLARWVAELQSRGVSLAYLTTDRANNEGANRFYVRAGWVLKRWFITAQGREMNHYEWVGAAQKGHG
jgi:ribosomal protein S18 acetylase RimI-like enzyme